MCNNTAKTIEAELDEIAHFFAHKTTDDICFADADTADFKIYSLYQEWTKACPESFSEQFPYFDQLWEILSSWKVGEAKSHSDRQQIIDLAQKHLQS